MSIIIVIDCETYYGSGYSLRKMTIAEYVHDHRFHVHGIAIRYPDGHSEFRTDVRAAIAELQQLYGQNLERAIVIMHNACFDQYILRHRFGLSIRFIIDTMLLSYHVHGRKGLDGGEDASLKGLAARYGLPAKGELDFMMDVRHPDAQQLAQLAKYARNDVGITHDLAFKLVPQLTRPEVELGIAMHAIVSFTERGIRIDMARLERLEARVKQELAETLAAANVSETDVSKTKLFQALLEKALARTNRLVPLKQGKGGLIPAIAKKDPEMIALCDDDDPVVAMLACARTEKKGADQILAKLRTLARIANATGGFLPPYLLYHGALTGRFAGGQKFNLQNLGKSGAGVEMRRLLIGNGKIVTGDLAQIEARVTAWLAGEPTLLSAFASGRDIYSEFASKVFSTEVRKPRDDDPPETRARLVPLRQVGKTSVLGLGFAMGALRFMNTLRADPSTAQLFDAGLLSPLECRNIVKAFREEFPRIPASWESLDKAFRLAIDGIASSVGPLRFSRVDKTVIIHLPSGRALRYADARLEDEARAIKYLDDAGEEAEFVPPGSSIVYSRGIPLYGGKICENVVQAIARDVLVETILRLEARNIEVLFHCHDEIVIDAAAPVAAEVETILKSELETVPVWAAGLPIAAEVKTMDHYDK